MTNKEENSIEVDFAHRDTEAGWQSILDAFGKKGAPIWFNWLGWLLLLGVLLYIFKRSQSILIAIAIAISVIFLWLYFQAFFFNIRFKNVPILSRCKNQRVVSIILSGIMAYVFWEAALRVVKVVMEHQ